VCFWMAPRVVDSEVGVSDDDDGEADMAISRGTRDREGGERGKREVSHFLAPTPRPRIYSAQPRIVADRC
jgi:hypothetical protein